MLKRALLLAGPCIAAGAGGALIATGHGRYAVVLLIVAGAYAALCAFLLWAARGGLDPELRGAPPRPTGRTLSRIQVLRPAPGTAVVWTGSARTGTGEGVTGPLARLTLDGDILSLTFRIRGFGLVPKRWSTADVRSIYPARRRLSPFRYVAIDDGSAIPTYFWTSGTIAVLSLLENAGFPVDWTERALIGVLGGLRTPFT